MGKHFLWAGVIVVVAIIGSCTYSTVVVFNSFDATVTQMLNMFKSQ